MDVRDLRGGYDGAMCERYARFSPLTAWLDLLGGGFVAEDSDLVRRLGTRPRYNIAPGESGWILAVDECGALRLGKERWYFPRPFGYARVDVRDARIANGYREHFNEHRCVVLADGFYNPMKEVPAGLRPWAFFRRRDEWKPLFIGGILGPFGFAMLTRVPVTPIDDIPGQVPVCVPEDDVLGWLDPEVDGDDALARFAPWWVEDDLVYWRVGDAVKQRRRGGRSLMESSMLREMAEDRLPTCDLSFPPV